MSLAETSSNPDIATTESLDEVELHCFRMVVYFVLYFALFCFTSLVCILSTSFWFEGLQLIEQKR